MGLIKSTLLIYFSSLFFINTYAAVSLPDTAQWKSISVAGNQKKVIYIPALYKPKGALIIIQGSDEQKFEQSIIHYLRKKLPIKGWATLGINIPNKLNQSSFISAEKQLEQAALMLETNNTQTVYVLLYGKGAASLLTHFIDNKIKNIKGIILLSAYANKLSSYNKIIKTIPQWATYIYDIRAQYDIKPVSNNLMLRKNIFESVKPFYRTHMVSGASNDYSNSQSIVLKLVHGWLSRITKSSS